MLCWKHALTGSSLYLLFSFMAKDGRIYAIPENIDNVMVITPGDSASAEMIV